MIKILKPLLTVALAFIALLAVGQSKADKALQKKIIGTWEFTKMEFVANEKATEEDKSMAEIGTAAAAMFSSITYVFKNNGSYQQLHEEEEITGTWKIENSALTMVSDNQESDDKPLSIELTKDILTLSSEASEGLMAKLVLKRKK